MRPILLARFLQIIRILLAVAVVPGLLSVVPRSLLGEAATHIGSVRSVEAAETVPDLILEVGGQLIGMELRDLREQGGIGTAEVVLRNQQYVWYFASPTGLAIPGASLKQGVLIPPCRIKNFTETDCSQSQATLGRIPIQPGTTIEVFLDAVGGTSQAAKQLTPIYGAEIVWRLATGEPLPLDVGEALFSEALSRAAELESAVDALGAHSAVAAVARIGVAAKDKNIPALISAGNGALDNPVVQSWFAQRGVVVSKASWVGWILRISSILELPLIMAIEGTAAGGNLYGTVRASIPGRPAPPITPPLAPPLPNTGCQFQLGFKTLRDQIPESVGDCVEDEHPEQSTGNTLQKTTKGLLVWRKIDNWTAYTNGYWTWLNGPFGLQQRLNTETLDWEQSPITTAPVPQPMPQPGPAPVPKPVSIQEIQGVWVARGECDWGAFSRRLLFSQDRTTDGRLYVTFDNYDLGSRRIYSLAGSSVIIVDTNSKRSEWAVAISGNQASFTETGPSRKVCAYERWTDEKEREAQANYGRDRGKYLSEHPWVLKMPLRTEDYWINYSQEQDVFDVLIYLFKWIRNQIPCVNPQQTCSALFEQPKEPQVQRIRQRVARDLAAVGVDVNKAKINYTEKFID